METKVDLLTRKIMVHFSSFTIVHDYFKPFSEIRKAPDVSKSDKTAGYG